LGGGDDCDQLWFYGVEEALVEALERGIVADGDQGTPMKRAARTCDLPPPMKLLPFHWPDWRVQGARPDEGGDFAPVEAAEFGQFGDQGAGDGRPDSGHGGEQVLVLPPGRRAAHRLVDVGLEAGELLLQRGEQTAMLFCRRFSIRRFWRWRSATIIWTI
jgi:hypothetical protein